MLIKLRESSGGIHLIIVTKTESNDYTVLTYFHIMDFFGTEKFQHPQGGSLPPDRASVSPIHVITLLVALFLHLYGLLHETFSTEHSSRYFFIEKVYCQLRSYSSIFQRLTLNISPSLKSSLFSLSPYIFLIPDSATHIPCSEKGGAPNNRQVTEKK